MAASLHVGHIHVEIGLPGPVAPVEALSQLLNLAFITPDDVLPLFNSPVLVPPGKGKPALFMPLGEQRFFFVLPSA